MRAFSPVFPAAFVFWASGLASKQLKSSGHKDCFVCLGFFFSLHYNKIIRSFPIDSIDVMMSHHVCVCVCVHVCVCVWGVPVNLSKYVQ